MNEKEKYLYYITRVFEMIQHAETFYKSERERTNLE
jgi:hypothetical protein